MASIKAWAILAGGVWVLGAALGAAAGEPMNPQPVPPAPALAGDAAGTPATGWEVEPLLVTPPLVAGCAPPGSECGHARKLLEWFTYSSTQPGLCHCCKQYYPCCTAPLYTYFPCRPEDGCCAVGHGHAGPGVAARAKDWLCGRPCWDHIHEFGERIRYKKPAACCELSFQPSEE